MNESDSLRRQIYNSLSLRQTEELLQIWTENKRWEWTDQAFEALEEILLGRLEELPEQNEPEYVQVDEQEREEELAFFDANPPEFYEPLEVLWLVRWIRRVAVAAAVSYFIGGIGQFSTIRNIVLSYFMNSPGTHLLVGVISAILIVLTSGVLAVLTYFSLRALASILRILMQMEFNSRSVQEELAEEC